MTFHIKLNQVIVLMDACIENAEALHNSAELLFSSGHFPRSAALSILALEELGKMIMCDGLANAMQGSTKAKRFDKKRTDHLTKLSYVDHLDLFLQVIRILDDDPKSGIFEIQDSNWRHTKNAFEQLAPQRNGFYDLDFIKQSALYVGFSQADGEIKRPTTEISARLAGALQKYVHQSVKSVSYVWTRNRQQYVALWARVRDLDQKEYEALTPWLSELSIDVSTEDKPDDGSSNCNS